MRRVAILGALIGVGALVVRARKAELHQRLVAHCKATCERTPGTFPSCGAVHHAA